MPEKDVLLSATIWKDSIDAANARIEALETVLREVRQRLDHDLGRAKMKTLIDGVIGKRQEET